MHTEIADSDIIEQVRLGNSAAYGMLVRRYQAMVFTIALRYVRSREDAEEMAQDAFVKAYRALPEFRGTAKFSTWLYTIVTTTCISALRKKKLEVHSLDDEHIFARADNMDGGTSANEVEGKSRRNMVAEAIRLLNPEDAQVILLFYKGEQTLEEIAQLLGKEQNAVKVQLHRARSRLKEKMQQHFAADIRDL